VDEDREGRNHTRQDGSNEHQAGSAILVGISAGSDDRRDLLKLKSKL
jgi:hypothetical protein